MPKNPLVVEFFWRAFFADGRVLTPRLETESLLRRSIESLRKTPADAIVDVGTGSGILAVSLKKEFPLIPTYGTDISPDALEVAEKNARDNGASVEFLLDDLAGKWGETHFSVRFPFFVANLPYIRTGDPLVGEDVLADDPALALYGGDATGAETIARFLSEIADWSERNRPELVRVALEFGHDQLETVSGIATKLGFTPSPFADYSGIFRFLLLSYAPRPLEARP